jgi:hypothetical protein
MMDYFCPGCRCDRAISTLEIDVAEDGSLGWSCGWCGGAFWRGEGLVHPSMHARVWRSACTEALRVDGWVRHVGRSVDAVELLSGVDIVRDVVDA